MKRAEWLKNLANGTRVAIVEVSNRQLTDRVIHYGMIRVTPSGRYYLETYGRLDWRKGVHDISGGGRRAIVPAGVDGKIIELDED